MYAAFRAAVVAASSHSDPELGQLALDRLIATMTAGALTHASVIKLAGPRTEALCGELQVIVREACRLASEAVVPPPKPNQI